MPSPPDKKPFSPLWSSRSPSGWDEQQSLWVAQLLGFSVETLLKRGQELGVEGKIWSIYQQIWHFPQQQNESHRDTFFFTTLITHKQAKPHTHVQVAITLTATAFLVCFACLLLLALLKMYSLTDFLESSLWNRGKTFKDQNTQAYVKHTDFLLYLIPNMLGAHYKKMIYFNKLITMQQCNKVRQNMSTADQVQPPSIPCWPKQDHLGENMLDQTLSVWVYSRV